MKKVHLMSWLILFFSLFPSVLQAQSYNELWKEVEVPKEGLAENGYWCS